MIINIKEFMCLQCPKLTVHPATEVHDFPAGCMDFVGCAPGIYMDNTEKNNSRHINVPNFEIGCMKKILNFGHWFT